MKEFDLVGVATHRRADTLQKIKWEAVRHPVVRCDEAHRRIGGNHVNVLSEYPLTEHLKRDSRSSS